MARYLITQDDNILKMVKAKSIREAVNGLNMSGDVAEVQVYTVTSLRTVKFETVQETRLTVGADASLINAGDDEEE